MEGRRPIAVIAKVVSPLSVGSEGSLKCRRDGTIILQRSLKVVRTRVKRPKLQGPYRGNEYEFRLHSVAIVLASVSRENRSE